MRILILLIIATFCQIMFGQLYVNDTLFNSNHCFAPHFQEYLPDIPEYQDYNFNSASVDNTCLKIKIGYGGGCGTVYTKLLADTSHTNETGTVRLLLEVDDNENCKALIFQTLQFDLTCLHNLKKPLQLKLARYNETITFY